MATPRATFGFPFGVNDAGAIAACGGDEAIRGKIIQVLFTAPGERVNLPEFGCGLRELVFDPTNEILAATTEFAVAQSLQRWLGAEIIVQKVDVEARDGELSVEVAYTRRDRVEQGRIKIAF